MRVSTSIRIDDRATRRERSRGRSARSGEAGGIASPSYDRGRQAQGVAELRNPERLGDDGENLIPRKFVMMGSSDTRSKRTPSLWSRSSALRDVSRLPAVGTFMSTITAGEGVSAS
jgi:hypothetical protein